MTDAECSSNNTTMLSVSGLSRKRTFRGIQKSISKTIKKVTKKAPHLDETCRTGSNEAVFRYGNYNRYYGYRNKNHQEDQRLAVFKKEWFQNKSVLDVGSNVGHVSLWIGKHFNPSRIKGVDIDLELVKAAKKNIIHYIDEHYVTDLAHTFNNQEPCHGLKVDNKDNVIADDESESFSKKAKMDIDVSNSDPSGKQITLSVVKNTDNQNGVVSTPAAEQVTIKAPPPPRPPPPKCRTRGSVGVETPFSEIDGKMNSLQAKQDDTSSTDEHIDASTETKESTTAITLICSDARDEIGEKNEPDEKKAKADEEDERNRCQEEQLKLLEHVEMSKGSTVEGVFPYNVSFVLENYVPPAPQVLKYAKPEYDVILCLSVTKWVQLNFGDAGLKMMFEKMFKQLRPGGLLILEPQPYRSYKRRKNLTSAIRRNYDAMELMPDGYVEYLLSPEIGFVTCEKIADDLHEKEGFKRPIYLLTKN